MQSLWWSQDMWFYLSKCATFPLDFKQNEKGKCIVCFLCTAVFLTGFPSGSVVKNLLAYAGDMCLMPGSGTSPGEGNGNPLHYFCLGNPMDRGAWQAMVHKLSKSRRRLKGLSMQHEMTDYLKCSSSKWIPYTKLCQVFVCFCFCFSHVNSFFLNASIGDLTGLPWCHRW